MPDSDTEYINWICLHAFVHIYFPTCRIYCHESTILRKISEICQHVNLLGNLLRILLFKMSTKKRFTWLIFCVGLQLSGASGLPGKAKPAMSEHRNPLRGWGLSPAVNSPGTPMQSENAIADNETILHLQTLVLSLLSAVGVFMPRQNIQFTEVCAVKKP